MSAHAIIWCGSHKPDTPLDLRTSENDIEQAVLAAHALGVEPGDVWAFVCDRVLMPPKFRGDVRDADAHEFRIVAGQLARSSDVSRLLFVATNHGVEDGLLTVTGALDEYADPSSHLLTPELLREILDAIPGQQVVVIAACYAGIFLPLASERRCVITARDAEHRYHRSKDGDDPVRSSFLHELLAHWAGTRIGGYEPPERCALDQAFAAAKRVEPWILSAGPLVW